MMPQDYSLMAGFGQQNTMLNPGSGGGLQLSQPQIAGFGGIGAGAGGGAPAGGPSIMDSFLQQTNKDGVTSGGYGSAALGAASGLFNAFMGMKQYGLAKEGLAESKKQFGLNYDAQRQTTNASLEDRQRARVASNGGAYQSVGDYMNKNAIASRG